MVSTYPIGHVVFSVSFFFANAQPNRQAPTGHGKREVAQVPSLMKTESSSSLRTGIHFLLTITSEIMTREEPVTVNGKVLQLHFACRAELPYGSSLRVTSSSLWSTVGNGYVSTAQGGDDDFEQEQKSLYASSVELVTTPADYPLWTTRTPVVCVVNEATGDGVFRHRYRYLVVTPGAGILSYDIEDKTSDEEGGCVDVTMWEDPFEKNKGGGARKVRCLIYMFSYL